MGVQQVGAIAVFACALLPSLTSPALAGRNEQSDRGNTAPHHAAPGRGDQNDALKAVASGKAVPFNRLIRSLGTSLGGQIIDARLLSRGSMMLYDLTILTDAGSVKHVVVDAKTGARR